MALNHLAENLRLMCSYGKSTSDICRRVGINRQRVLDIGNAEAGQILVCAVDNTDRHAGHA